MSEAYFRNQYLSPNDGILTVAGFDPDLPDASDSIVSNATWIMPQRNVEWIEIEDTSDHHILHDPVALLEMNRFRLFRSTYPIPIHSENGLVLFVDELNARPSLFICNPITKEYMTFPNPPPAAPRPPDHSIFSSNYPNGYGFGRNTDDGAYRVVLIRGPQAAVYTLGSGQWVIKTPDMGCTFWESTGITVGNGIHWLVDQMENKDEKENGLEMDNEVEAADGDEAEAEARVLRICRFDLNSQTFNLMDCIGVHPRPDDGDPMLGVLNKKLCICFSTRLDDAAHHEESHISVWVMSEVHRDWSLYIHVQGGQWIEGSMIKSLADGDHLMIGSSSNIVRGSGYAYWTGATRKILVYNTPTNSFVSEFELNKNLNMMEGVCYRPSVFSIKDNFGAESERVFHLS